MAAGTGIWAFILPRRGVSGAHFGRLRLLFRISSKPWPTAGAASNLKRAGSMLGSKMPFTCQGTFATRPVWFDCIPALVAPNLTRNLVTQVAPRGVYPPTGTLLEAGQQRHVGCASPGAGDVRPGGPDAQGEWCRGGGASPGLNLGCCSSGRKPTSKTQSREQEARREA